MLPLVRIVQVHAILCCLLTSTFAKDDPDYDPSSNLRPGNVTGLGGFYSWVGSYYNATAEVELRPVYGDSLDEPMCFKLENYTSTVKFDAFLSILERGPGNAGSNSVNFWLTLIPQTSPPFNVSSLGADLLYQNHGFSYPVLSTNPTPDGFGNPPKGGVDNFNFTTSRTREGAYDLSGSMKNADLTATSIATNFTLPVCNTTYLTGDYNVDIRLMQWWTTEDWDDFRYPNVSVQFDDKTANLTLDGVFYAGPYVQSNYTEMGGPTKGSPGAHGFIQVRFSGALDAYHSDSLRLDADEPSWLRTVGFGNASSNIGHGSKAGRPRFEPIVALMAVMITVGAMLL